MARRYELITELYERIQKGVTLPDKWQEFLSSACQNYKLPFDEQRSEEHTSELQSPG